MWFLVWRWWSICVVTRSFGQFDRSGDIVSRLRLLHVLGTAQCYDLLAYLSVSFYRGYSRISLWGCIRRHLLASSSPDEAYTLLLACLLGWWVRCWNHLYLHGLHLVLRNRLSLLSSTCLKHSLSLMQVRWARIWLVMGLTCIWIIGSHCHWWMWLCMTMISVATVGCINVV